MPMIRKNNPAVNQVGNERVFIVSPLSLRLFKRIAEDAGGFDEKYSD